MTLRENKSPRVGGAGQGKRKMMVNGSSGGIIPQKRRPDNPELIEAIADYDIARASGDDEGLLDAFERFLAAIAGGRGAA